MDARAMGGSGEGIRLPWMRHAWTRAYAEIRLTALAVWRGITGIYHSNDLTFAASIAYYSLLSLFPFFLLALAILPGCRESRKTLPAPPCTGDQLPVTS